MRGGHTFFGLTRPLLGAVMGGGDDEGGDNGEEGVEGW
jgi:hypothetical protein